MGLRLLLDTDIGSDIDDAVCLAYLLAQPDCDLLGITTVSGEPERRAMIASALCRAAGRDVPIYPGAAAPLLRNSLQPTAPQAAALPGWPHTTEFSRHVAVDFMRRAIRAHPGDVTLLAIGPLTNVALLFALDPDIPHLLRELVIMGGHYVRRLAGIKPVEWNIMCDPHAAAMVFASPAQARLVGLEVTHQVVMDAGDVRSRFEAGLLRPVLDFAEVWFQQRDRIVFHDPLAAAVIFDEAISTFERGTASVELGSERLAGYTFWEPDAEGRHGAAAVVDPARFFQHFFGLFEGA